MADTKIAGIMRAGAFSPNHIGNDAAIFNGVADQLRRRGFEVRVYTEQEFQRMEIPETYIVNMCREAASIEKLQALEHEGRLVVNSGYGISNCTRERMTRILTTNGIPYPESLIVNTNEAIIDDLRKAGYGACWIKRGDSHSQHKEDVSYCRHEEEAQEVLKEYFYRGIRRAVINRHLEGDLIKFYGVGDNPFFYWFYPFNEGVSKYGLEKINGLSQGLNFDEAELKRMCDESSRLLNVKIYGGDCIVDPGGTIRIIDFNDWPSFAPCRQEAAPVIAKEIIAMIKKHRKGCK